MTSISALNENLHDVKKLSSLFGSTLSDITITDRAAKTPENSRRFGAFMEKLKDLDHVKLVYSAEHEYMSIDGQKMLLSAVYLFTDKMFVLLFQSIGIAQFHADVTILSVVLPVTVLACFLAVFSYLISRRIKNTGTRQLAGE